MSFLNTLASRAAIALAFRRDVIRGGLISALRVWRNEDHEDNITLSRSEVCRLLDEIDR